MALTGKRNLTPKEKFIVGNYIIKHCTIPEGQQFAKWDEESGGTDVTAAERLRVTIPTITVFHVRGLRQAFDLPLEPARLFFARQREERKLTEIEALRDKVEALVAHVKECDVRLKDHAERLKVLDAHNTLLHEHVKRIQALEDRYTAPKR